MMETNETIQSAEKKPRKSRSPFDKEGSFKYLQKWMRRVEDKLDYVRRRQDLIFDGLGLGGYLLYDRPYLHNTVCTNEFDASVLEELYNGGQDGKLPKDVAAALNKQYHTRRFQPWTIRYMLKRMNRTLQAKRGENVAEKRGMRWALTSFARKAWGLSKAEMQEEVKEWK